MKNSLFLHNKEILGSLIAENPDIGIIVGVGDADKMGAALALYLSLKSDQKNVQVISKKEPTVELSHLVAIDKVKTHFEGGVKVLTVSIPYQEGEIEKVSYNIEGTRLNINLFAAGSSISFHERDVQYLRKGSIPLLLLCMGVSSLEEIMDIVSLDRSAKVVNIDKNPANSLYGDVVLVDPGFSSISEVIAKILLELSLPIDIDSAQNLMDGLLHATGNFSIPTTSAYAFEAASYLLRNGAARRSTLQDGGRRRHAPQRDAFISTLEEAVVKEATQEVVGDEREGVPQDWFTPKVFKGSSTPRNG